jgi:hypothetical protein
MEVKIDEGSVVAAYCAAPACLLDEDALQLLLASRDSLTDASLAAPSLSAYTAPLVVELNPPMALAEAHFCRVARRGSPASADQGNWGIHLPCHEQMFA